MALADAAVALADAAVALDLSGPPHGVSRANASTADGSCWVRRLRATCTSPTATDGSAVACTRSGELADLAETVAPLLRAIDAPLLGAWCSRRSTIRGVTAQDADAKSYGRRRVGGLPEFVKYNLCCVACNIRNSYQNVLAANLRFILQCSDNLPARPRTASPQRLPPLSPRTTASTCVLSACTNLRNE